MRVKLELGQTW